MYRPSNSEIEFAERIFENCKYSPVYGRADITYDNDHFKIVEYVNLGLQNNYKYYKLEETKILFDDNANYNIETKLLFEPPEFDKKVLHHIYNANNAILKAKKRTFFK